MINTVVVVVGEGSQPLKRLGFAGAIVGHQQRGGITDEVGAELVPVHGCQGLSVFSVRVLVLEHAAVVSIAVEGVEQCKYRLAAAKRGGLDENRVASPVRRVFNFVPPLKGAARKRRGVRVKTGRANCRNARRAAMRHAMAIIGVQCS